MRLDREQIIGLNSGFRELYMDMARRRQKHPDETIIESYDFVPQIHVLYETLYEKRNEEKIYYLSPKVVKRIYNMDISAFLGPDNLATKMVFLDDECKHIVFEHQDKNYGICCAVYCVKDGRLYMKVFSGEYIAGYVIFNEKKGDALTLIPWNVFSMLAMNSLPDEIHWRDIRDQIDIVKKDFPTEPPTPNNLYRISKRKDFSKLKSHDIIEDYLIFRDILLTAMQAVIFMKTAEVYSQEYVRDQTPTYRRKKNYRPLNYTLVDTTWDMNIDVNNPFPVRGHFKMQACKIAGKWDHKLIYIESYMKTGYHRRAIKLIENDNERHSA